MTGSWQGTVLRCGLAGALIALSACAGDTNPVRDVLVATGVGAEPRPAQEFVARSRPDKLDYMPVGVSAPPRPPGKNATQVKEVEAEMDELRAANEAEAERIRQLGATPPPEPAPAPVNPAPTARRAN